MKAIAKKPSPAVKGKVSSLVVVSSLKKKAAPIFTKLKKIEKIKTQEDLHQAAEYVKALKELSSIASDEEEDMTSGIKDTLKRIREHFKPFQDDVAKADYDTKLLISKFLDGNNLKLHKVSKDFEVGGMSVTTYAKKTAQLQIKKGAAKIRKLKRLHIYDLAKIPREYLFPNENGILSALNNGVKVPGAKLIEIDSIAI
jgi:hypothetical protein